MDTNNSVLTTIKCLFTGFFLFSFSGIFAQVADDFSDGDLSSNPTWFGMTDLFEVNLLNELQLKDPDPEAANVSSLYLPAPTSTDDLTTWELFFRMEFAPSTSNFGRIFLSASETNLDGDLQGYFLKLGGISGDQDALELYRQDDGSTELLISGTAGALGNDPAIARVRVTRTDNGLWELFADYSGGTDYQSEGQAIDATYPAGDYFGLTCVYSSTRNESFFFDDFLIDPIFEDVDPPELLLATALSATQVEVKFNEQVDLISGETSSNYQIDQGIGIPTSAQLDPMEAGTVILNLATPLVDGQSYELTVSGVSDVSGNAIGSGSANFQYFEVVDAAPFDVVINEIMADPTPSIGLPNLEFIELYNRTDKSINLEGWSVNSGSAPAFLPDYLLPPGAYVLLCDDSDATFLAPFGEVIGLDGFPALSNVGDEIGLVNDVFSLIHLVAYTDDWYQSSAKKDGGWTLEMINPSAPCLGQENWIASESITGGTPGLPNSVLSEAPDESGPEPILVYPEGDFQVLVIFNEVVDSTLATDISNYSISPPLPIDLAIIDMLFRDRIYLLLDEAMVPDQIYTLTINTGLTDCISNSAESKEIKFGLPVLPAAGELLINEVLFLPEVGGNDFIEIYHAGDRPFDLNDLLIGNIQEESDSLVGVDVRRLVFPGEYIVLTESPGDILERYEVLNPDWLIRTDLPVYSDPAGNITIATLGPDNTGLILDVFDYSNEMHHQLLDETRGVSLERLRLSEETNEASNWHSAAATIGFASPTAPNSQEFESRSGNNFRLAHSSFSPDGDGFRDVLLLDYDLEEPGFVANIRVFDSRGRQTNVLAENTILANSGTFQWDGVTVTNDLAPMGIYVIWIEYFHPDGRRFEEKISGVLAKDLR